MTEKYLVINLNLFTRDSSVILITNNEDSGSNVALGQYRLEELPEIINQLAIEQDVTNIKIAGSSKYAPLIEYGIKQTEAVKYSKNNLNIEVIE